MGVEVLAPLGLFAMVVLIVYISVNAGTQKRKLALGTVEEAIKAGQQVTPELVRSLGMPKKDSNGDLKSGAILLAVAAAMIVFGKMIAGLDDDPEAAMVFTGMAAFPGFIGFVLLGFGFFGKNKKDDA